MKKSSVLLVSCLFASLCMLQQAMAGVKIDSPPFQELLKRIVKSHSNMFVVELVTDTSGTDFFELGADKGKILLRGNNCISLAVGLNHYLKYYCHTSVSWNANDPVELPAVLPLVPQPVKQNARVKNRFFLNYCTFGYTMPWWQWKDWERLIDWMALNGINMPLAITGQEAIWHKVWQKFGLTDEQIRSYFTGPAHLPWHRMANLDKWQGPLPLSYIDHQLALQKQIVERERALQMTPVLPAFAGHVPEALREKYPASKISRLGEWGGFPDEYRSYFLDPFDPLFKQIQKEFLAEQEKEFGTDHIYGTDPFNEVKPPSWEPAYLADVSRTIYHSMTEADSSATWLMMAWIFYFEREHWTNERVKAFVNAVPQDKLMLLDYFCENTEVWQLTDTFYKQPYLWCYLGNFGGNTMLAGNLAEVEKRMEHALTYGGSNLVGIGSTLEALDVNPMMYEYVFEKAWSQGTVDYVQWVDDWATRRTGTYNNETSVAWKLLLDSVYNRPAALGQATLTNARPSLEGHGNWTTVPTIHYPNQLLFTTWEKLVAASGNNSSAAFDVVNIGRQTLGNYFLELRNQFTHAYKNRHLETLERTGIRMLELLNDLDSLLNTHHSFLLGTWLQQARSFGKNEPEKKYYEANARVLITTWGGKGQSLNDYANRSWGGLVKSYYAKRWKMFIVEVIEAARTGQAFDEKAFHERVTAFELAWTKQNDSFNTHPIGNSYTVARGLIRKYRSYFNSSK
jgi:Alpha-N-acetylglucosaminidase (NAGLU).